MIQPIHAQIALQRVLELYPGAQRALFRHYHIGGCSSCAFQPGETLGALCQRNQLDVNEVFATIRTSHEQDAAVLIEPLALARQLAENGITRLLDIRSREEFDTTHLPGASLLSQPTMQEMLSLWPREALLVIYDHRGGQALDAVAYFQGQGFKNVRALRGGLDAWSLEVDPKIPRYRVEQAAA